MAHLDADVMETRYIWSDESSLELPAEITADSTVSFEGTIAFSNKNNKNAEEESESSLSIELNATDKSLAGCTIRSRQAQKTRDIERNIVCQWRDETGDLQFQFKEPVPGSRWSSFKTGSQKPVGSHSKENVWEQKLRQYENARLQD